MENNKVYVLEETVCYEGATLLGIFSTKEKASQALNDYVRNYTWFLSEEKLWALWDKSVPGEYWGDGDSHFCAVIEVELDKRLSCINSLTNSLCIKLGLLPFSCDREEEKEEEEDVE